jgi:hypothetical protein
MKLKEFKERELFVDDYGKVYDQDLNEYRDAKGSVEFLKVSDFELLRIWRRQHKDIKSNLIKSKNEW